MDVYEAVRSRRAVRAFTDEPVSREVLERVLSAAAWAPSGSNIQPWHVYVLTGEPLVELKRRAGERVAAGDPGDEREYEMYPAALKSPYHERRSAFGKFSLQSPASFASPSTRSPHRSPAKPAPGPAPQRAKPTAQRTSAAKPRGPQFPAPAGTPQPTGSGSAPAASASRFPPTAPAAASSAPRGMRHWAPPESTAYTSAIPPCPPHCSHEYRR